MDFEELGVCVGVLSINVFSIVGVEYYYIIFSIEVEKSPVIARDAERIRAV